MEEHCCQISLYAAPLRSLFIHLILRLEDNRVVQNCLWKFFDNVCELNVHLYNTMF